MGLIVYKLADRFVGDTGLDTFLYQFAWNKTRAVADASGTLDFPYIGYHGNFNEFTREQLLVQG